MANSISVRAANFISFVIDTNAGGAAAVSVLCNRDYLVADVTLINTTADPISGTIASTAGTICTINAVAANAIVRPSLTGAPGAGAMNLSATLNDVDRGSTLTVTMTAAADLCQGTITILPGNRYSATTSTSSYYANNSASGTNLPGASNATVSI